MCDDIMHRVAGRCTTVGDAMLKNFQCLAVKDEVYPAIIGRRGASTGGVLYDDITDQGFQSLDDFEGEMYDRITVGVTLKSGMQIDAYTYVFRPEFAHLLTDREWHFEDFLERGKPAFVDRYIGFSKI